MPQAQTFPLLRGRNLEGLDEVLPDGFQGSHNIVAIAFHRSHQSQVDSWVPWFESRSMTDPGLRFYELPTIGRRWVPFRRFIDGGMAAAIRNPISLRRTITVYDDVGKVSRALGIKDRSTITVMCVNRSGRILWRGTGGVSTRQVTDLERVLDSDCSE